MKAIAVRLYYSSLFFAILSVGMFLMLFLASCSSDDSTDGDDNPGSSGGVGQLMGTVKDEDGNPYENVRVELKVGVPLEAATLTDGTGTYSFSNVDAGDYDVRLILPLASTAISPSNQSVSIQKNASAEVNFVIGLNPIEASVTVGPGDLLGEVKTETGATPTNPDDLLYSVNVFTDQALNPLLGPDGEQVTLDEWDNAEGVANIYCDGETTHLDFSFTGLLPNGVYTLWLGPYTPPANMLGTGAMGNPNGTENILDVDANGNAEITIEMNPGPLSVFGILSSCVLTHGTEMIIVLDYHLDNQTHGPSPGADPTEVAHMLFVF